MKKLLTLSLLVFAFSACTKDDPPSATPGGLLDRVVQTEGTDTTISSYTYDANNKLTGYKFLSNRGGDIDSIVIVVARDGQGRMVQRTVRENQYTPVVYTITYNGNTSQLKSRITTVNGLSVDSSSFVYNGSNIVEHLFYTSGSSWIPEDHVEYIFQNGNMVTMKNYDLSTGNVDETTTFTYDSKSPVLQRSPEEGVIDHMWELGFVNNITGVTSSWPSNPLNNETVNVSYTYTTTGQPLTAVAVATPGGTTSLKFYYK